MVPKETTPRGQTPRQTSTIYRPAQRSRSKSPSGNNGKDTEKKKQKSGRRSKSPGHANGRCKSESRRPSSRAESNVSIATTRTDQDADDSKSNKKQKRREERETRTLCKTVQTKLEHFINFEQRETSFGAISNQTTTKRMLYYDVQYKLKEAEKERKEARKKKKEKKEKNNDDKKINPRRHEGSIQMVSQSKVNKLSASANQIMESVPVSRLNTIHRYRLHSPATPNTPENGKVQNYCSHVGAALHSDNYVQYYVQQGLHSGKSEDERDGDGSEEKKDDDTESKCSSGKRDTKKRGKETKKKGDGKKQSKEDKKDKDQKQREYDSLAWRSGDGDADQDDARSYTDSFVSDNEEDESVRSGSRARSRSRSRSRTPSRSRRSSRASRSRSGSRASRSRSRSRAGSRTSKHNSDDEDVENLDRASNYNYSENFEPSPTHSRTSLQKRGDKAATKDPDTVSVQTYSQCDSMTWKSGGRFRARGADDSDNESILSREAY